MSFSGSSVKYVARLLSTTCKLNIVDPDVTKSAVLVLYAKHARYTNDSKP